MKTLTNRIAVLAAAAAGLFATQAKATTLSLVGPDTNRGSFVTFNFNGADKTAFAGALEYSVDGGAIIETFCVDLNTLAVLNMPYQAVALPPSILSNGGQVAFVYSSFNGSANDLTTGTALQLAIWDTLYDGGDGLMSGAFQAGASISSSILAQAATYITAGIGHTSADAVVWQSVLGVNDKQMQIGQVPEPGTYALLGTGLVLAGIRFRRRA